MKFMKNGEITLAVLPYIDNRLLKADADTLFSEIQVSDKGNHSYLDE